MISPLANLIISSLVFIETCISKIDFKTFNANSIVTPRDRSETLLLVECPLAVYTHCRAHCLNLAIVHSCDQPVIRNMLGILKETCNFFEYSPKRTDNLLLCVIEKDSPDAKKTTLKNMSKTRWVERHEAYEVYSPFSCVSCELLR